MEKQKHEEFTRYEVARILGARALQIAMGAPILLKLKEEDFEALRYNPINIAKKEFDEKNIFPNPAATEIVEFKEFYPAEEYHQDYYNKNPGLTCHALRNE